MRCAGLFGLAGLVAVGAFVLSGCDSQGQQDAFADQANLPPSNYTQTDEGGAVLREDPDDWRTAPFFLGRVLVDPAYPNPIQSGFVTVPVQIIGFNAVRGGLILRAFDANGRFILLDEIPTAEPGGHVFNFSVGQLGALGLHRLFIFDTAGELISYGDLKVE